MIKTSNLIRMYNYILLNVSEDVLDMECYRQDITIDSEPKCKSVGCIIGHCTALDYHNVLENYTYQDQMYDIKRIQFDSWSEDFTGISIKNNLWPFLFETFWASNPETNSKAQILARLKFVIMGHYTYEFSQTWYPKYGYQFIVEDPDCLEQKPIIDYDPEL